MEDDSSTSRPLTAHELVQSLDVHGLEELVRDKGAKLPPDWSDFTLKNQRAAVAAFLRGGITANGLQTAPKNFLDEGVISGIRERLADIQRLEKISDEPAN